MAVAKSSRWWGAIIGAGIALSPIHNQYLTQLTTNSKGETLFFLPAFGYLLLIMGTGLFLLNNWNRVKEVGWGDRRIVGCLLFIVLAVSASGGAYSGLQDRFAPMGMGIALFGVYLTARVIGRDLIIPLAVGSIVASLGIIVHQMVFPGQATGGFVFERNYDIATGYILLGSLVTLPLIRDRFRLWSVLLLVPLVALMLSGSAEAVFAIGILGLTVLLRRDWGIRTMVIAVPLVILVAGILFTPELQQAHKLTVWATTGSTQYMPADRNPDRGTALERRWNTIRDELSDIQPLGKGYNITDFSRDRMVHNVPLVIIQQLGYPGILAGLAWLFVSVWCLVRTKWRYLWVSVLALCVFDHFIFTQLAPYFWVLVGVSTAPDNVKSDLLFRRIE